MNKKQPQKNRKHQQLHYLINRLSVWRERGIFHQFSEEQQTKILQAFKRLWKGQAGLLSRSVLKKGLLILGMCAGMHLTSYSQNFDTVQQNPYGLSPAQAFAMVEWADLDGDGDLDLLVGEYGANYVWFENTGTITQPMFGAGVTNPFGLVAGNYLAKPAFVDIDGDGDLDLFSGELFGDIRYFENVGSDTLPSFASPVSRPFGLNYSNFYNFPEFIDLDSDGDYDLLVGEYNANLQYFENIGNDTLPNFAAPQMNPFGLTSGGAYFYCPAATDLDHDGDMDLLCGTYYGELVYFENTGDSATAAFSAPQVNPFGLSQTTPGFLAFPDFADLDWDGDTDLMVGTQYGGFEYYQQVDTSINLPPVMTELDDDSLCHNEWFIASFMVSDAEGDSLWFELMSDNQSLIPDSNLSLDVNLPNVDLTAIPLVGLTGQAGITVSAFDGSNISSFDFDLWVDLCNSAPQFGAIDSQSICNDTPLGPIAVNVMDADGDSLWVEWHSSDQSLVADSNIMVSGSAPNYSLELMPESGQIGSCTIYLAVHDAFFSDTTEFDLRVTDCTVGIEQLSDGSLNLFPNPVSNTLQLSWNEAVWIERMQLMDIQGRIIRMIAEPAWYQDYELAFDHYPAGIYTLHIQLKDGFIIRKIRKE